MSHKPRETSHIPQTSGEMEVQQAVQSSPASQDHPERNRERLESQLNGVRHDIEAVDQELDRFDTRLSGATTDDERLSLKEKRRALEHRGRVLLDREAFLLRKLASFTRAAEVQRHREAVR